jgi:hypothetical protein
MEEGRARGGQEHGPGRARAGGGCVSIPEAEALRQAVDSLPPGSLSKEFQPNLKSLNELILRYQQAASAPSLDENVRQIILEQVKNKDVKDIVLPILRDLFDGTPGDRITPEIMTSILNCILDALTNDLPLTTLIAMVCRMYIKAFYNDNSLRTALGAAFAGSVGYLTWVNGMNQIFGLGRESVIIILSAMAQCAHIVNDAHLYLQTLKGIIGEQLYGQIERVIDYLLPSAGGIFAMSNVYLMSLIYERDIFPAGVDLRQADSSEEATKARAAAPAAGGGGAPPPLQQSFSSSQAPADAAQAAAAQAAAQAAAAVPENSVFRQMYYELRRGAVSVGTHAKNHLVTLLRFATRIKDTTPGQVGEETLVNKLYSSANVYATACVNNAFDMFNTQAGQSAVDVSAKHLLSACLPSDFRTGGELEAREEIFLLAHRIKSNVIECLMANPRGMTREQATSDLEEAFPVFSSGLTLVNVDRLTASQLSTILRMLIKAADEHEFSGDSVSVAGGADESQESTKAEPPQTPLRARLATIKPDLMKQLRLDPSVFRNQEEEKELKEWVKANIGWLGSVIGMFDVSIGWVAQQARRSKLLQCGVQAVSSLGAELRQALDPGAAASQSEIFRKFPDLRQKLPAIGRFLTAPWIHVLNEISSKMHDGESYDKIITDLSSKYGIPKQKSEFKAYIKALLLRVDLEFIITRGGECSVQPKIVVFNKPDGTPYQAPVLTLSLPADRFYTNPQGVVVRTMDLKIEVFKDPVPLPGPVTQLAKTLVQNVQAAKEKSNKLISVVTSFCSKEVPPQFEVSVIDPPPLTIVPPLPQPMSEDLSQEQEQAEKQQAENQQTEDQQHIAACCKVAPAILGQLLEAQEVAGTIVAIQDAIDPNKEDTEAVEALLSAHQGSNMVEEQDQQQMLQQSNSVDQVLKRGAKDFDDITRAAGAEGVGIPEGGKSRTRRRRPATAKRTRRKAYNKKSNKRKSRKQISRRRQSRRK